MRALAVLACLLWMSPAVAATPSDAAREAQAMLSDAADALRAAESGRNQVRALTETVQAYEAGLSALREGMRAVAAQEARLSRDVAARDAQIGRLLGVLQGLSRMPAPAQLLHPAGPAGSLRAGMLVADVTPALQAEVDDLRSSLAEIHALQTLQAEAAATLEQARRDAQAARAALSQAVADREALPRRFIEDPIQTAVLLAATDTLESFAAGLAMIATEEAAAEPLSITAEKGRLPLPVAGHVLRPAGTADAAGVVRPGVLLATPAEALVTTPFAATIRYAGPLLNYGLVTILEPQPDTLFILAGMAGIFGETGQVLPAGDPVGVMGGASAAVSQMSDGAGNTRPETLYIEVRENGRTVDPESWFQTGRE